MYIKYKDSTKKELIKTLISIVVKGDSFTWKYMRMFELSPVKRTYVRQFWIN